MRLLLLISLILCLAMTSGCMVMDEVDAAAAKMPSSGKAKLAEKQSRNAGGTQSAKTAGENPVVEQTREWWKRASSLAPSDLEASIVRCDLAGGTQFMSRDDCLSRGGTPGRASS